MSPQNHPATIAEDAVGHGSETVFAQKEKSLVQVVDVCAVVALVALALLEELACEHFVRLVISSVLGSLSLVAVVDAIAIVALPLGASVGLLVVLGLCLSLICSILHRLRPCGSISLLGWGWKRERKWWESSR